MIQRGYVAGNFGLRIDGDSSLGWLYSFEGGMPNTEVVLEKIGPDHLQRKHVSQPKYEDLTVTFGTGMSESFWAWIQESFDRNYTRRHGEVIAADFNFKQTSSLEFFNALVSEVTFPALDASSRDNCKVSVKLTPEFTKFKVSPRGGAAVQFEGDQRKQKRWSPSNFRLKVDGVDCSRVFKIEALTLKQKLTDYAIGELRDIQKEPTQVEYPNLVVTVAESHSEAWWKWYDDFAVRGNNGEDAERTATLEYLTPTFDKALLTLSFDRVGIFKATPDKAEAGSEQIRRNKFELYCESMTFKYDPSAFFS